MESEDEIVERDHKSHPKCGYSMSQSESCSSQNGNNMVCEIAKRITRNCPGEHPFVIFNKTESSSGGHTMRSDGFGLIPGMMGDHDDSSVHQAPQIDPFKFMGSILDQFMKSGSDDSHSQLRSRPHVQPPPIPQLPPHYDANNQKIGQSKGKQGGYISGPVEEI